VAQLLKLFTDILEFKSAFLGSSPVPVLNKVKQFHTFQSCFYKTRFKIVGLGSAVGIATGYRLDDRDRELESKCKPRIFGSPYRPDTTWHPLSVNNGTNFADKPTLATEFIISSKPALEPTPIQWVQWALSPGVKRQEREADHSPPTSAEVKNRRIYTPTPHKSWHSASLVKHNYNFTLPYLSSI
jgi:hypothetical protein